MDYSCRDIPMRLDIRYQPLDFDIYLSQVIDIPRTSLDEPPYSFSLEREALEKVDRLIEQTGGNSINQLHDEQKERETRIEPNSDNPQEPRTLIPTASGLSDLPSCPTETPLTPVKSLLTEITPGNPETKKEGSPSNQINLRDFEEIHYNPFDHLELQTIDELRELNLVFQASYANQTNSNNQLNNSCSDPFKSEKPDV